MRVRIDKGWVLEVKDVLIGVDDNYGSTIIFTQIGGGIGDDYLEFKFRENKTLEEAENICDPMLKDLLEKGYADFSDLGLDEL